MNRPYKPKTKWEKGVLGIPRELVRSEAYLDLSVTARCLLIELQDVWNPSHGKVHYSVRRAANRLKVSSTTASRAFNELLSHGFIRVAQESDWFNGRAREYILNWLDYNGKPATCEWLDWPRNKKNTVSPE